MSTVEYIQNVEQINTYDDKSKEFGTLGDGKGKPLSLDPDDANTKRLLKARAIVTRDQVAKTSGGAAVLAGDAASVHDSPPATSVDGEAGQTGGDGGSDDVAVIPADDAGVAAWRKYATNPNGGGLSADDVKGKNAKQIKAMLA